MANPILRAFNEQFSEFIRDVRTVFPEDPDLLATQKAIGALTKSNPKLICKTWKARVAVPYASEIERGDVSFFINHDYLADMNGAEKTDQVVSAIDRFRSSIHNMNDSDMQKSMQYVQNLTKLSMAVN